MISDNDRSGWFGASDTKYIMGNWNTKTFQNWWLTKLGISTSNFRNTAMNAGTYYEHAILDALEDSLSATSPVSHPRRCFPSSASRPTATPIPPPL